MNTIPQTKHAVLTATHLFISTTNGQGPKVQKIALGISVSAITDVYTLAREHNVTHVWIMPDIDIDMNVGSEEWNVFATYEDDEERTRPMFARIYRKGTYGEVKVGFPHRGRWGWVVDSPVTVLATIYYLEIVLGVPCEWSPGHMGTELVCHLNRTAKRQEWVRESSIDLKPLPFNQSARDILWKCVRLPQGRYLHQLDKRSAYLSACPGVYVGAGDPVHVTGEITDTSLPGIYRVSSSFTVSEDDLLPPLITTEWITADVLTYAIEQGYEVTIHEAWQWTEKHKTLESYARKLWEGRRIFRENTVRFPHNQGRENAEYTMKEVALVATGKFASKKTSRFLRPDWWACVVGKTRVNIFRNLYTIFRDCGMTPVLIYSDSLYFVSDDPHPKTAVPHVMDRENELGGYKHEGTWLITAELIEVFNSTPSDKAGRVQKWLEHAPKLSEVAVA